MLTTCPYCQSEKLEAGRLQSTGRVAFVPDGAKFLTLRTSNVALAAHLCVDCGLVSFIGDTEKAGKITG